MKYYFFLILSLFYFISAGYSQEAGRFRGSGYIGYASPPSGLGFSFDADFRYVVTDNTNIGVKTGIAMMYRDFDYSILYPMASLTMHTNRYFIVHGDYYFNDGSKSFAPFLGGGFGNFNVFNMNA